LESDCRVQVAPFEHGLSLQGLFDIEISQNEAV
jgi:hypothetical protein